MITEFQGQYRFLSNFYPAPLTYLGRYYPTAEHAYQAAKARNTTEHDRIALSETPGIAKSRGRVTLVRDDWEEVKLSVMEEVVAAKFKLPHLADLLRLTGNAQLIEGNRWGDRFWGVCGGAGENHLGKILMAIRKQLLS